MSEIVGKGKKLFKFAYEVENGDGNAFSIKKDINELDVVDNEIRDLLDDGPFSSSAKGDFALALMSPTAGVDSLATAKLACGKIFWGFVG